MKLNLMSKSLVLVIVAFLLSSTVPVFGGSISVVKDSSINEDIILILCPLPLLSPPVTIVKKVRANSGDPWQDSITTSICSELEFKIEATNKRLLKRDVVITDILPDILDYVNGSANPAPDGYVNGTEEILVWVLTIPGLSKKTIYFDTEIVSQGYGENYVQVNTLIPGEDPDDDIVPVTVTNNPPNASSNPDPSDGATNVDINADLSWIGGDPNPCDTVTYDVYFEANDSTPDVLVSDNQSNTTYDLGTMEYNTHYYWQIVSWDNHGASTAGPIWDFTTESVNYPPVFSSENPNDGDTDVPITLSSLTVLIEDPEGDSFDWTIETSPDIGSSDGTGESNGTKTCAVSGLDYSTTYTWCVNATDPSGSGQTTTECFTFTTESNGTGIIVWSDDFNDGDISDWTIENPEKSGDLPITLEVSSDQSHSPQYSMLWDGPPGGNPDYSAEAWGPEVSIDITKPYSVEFWFRYNYAHWVHFVRFGHIDTLIDYPSLSLIFCDNNGYHWCFEQDFDTYCPTNTWTHFKFEVDPIASNITMIVDGNTIGTFNYYRPTPNEAKFYIRDPGAGANDYFDLSYYDDIIVTGQNDPPGAPDINGPSHGIAGTKYEYTFNAVDPDGDDVFYYINWGDGNYEEWIGPYDSGVDVKVNHTWNNMDTYIITAKAKDVFDQEGDLETLEVTMPKNKPFFHNSPLLSWLFERFPNAFPILRQLLEL